MPSYLDAGPIPGGETALKCDKLREHLGRGAGAEPLLCQMLLQKYAAKQLPNFSGG